jgi:hypothetical protein
MSYSLCTKQRLRRSSLKQRLLRWRFPARLQGRTAQHMPLHIRPELLTCDRSARRDLDAWAIFSRHPAPRAPICDCRLDYPKFFRESCLTPKSVDGGVEWIHAALKHERDIYGNHQSV